MGSDQSTNTGSSPLQCINPIEHPGWDELLATHPGATFFHTAGWAKVLQDTYGHRPKYFAVLRENQLRALLPVMEVDSWLTGRRGVSLPFTDGCEPLDCDSLLQKMVFPAAMQQGRERG
ncbi:MAG: hypothetical protein ABJC04_10785, partial [Verrucomicrobiota bacterium]